MSLKAILLSVDVGTSGTRASLFDDSGNEIPGASVRIASAKDLAETGRTNADDLLQQISATIDALLSQVGEDARHIELIALSCFWHSLVGVDNDGRPTTQLLGWSDMSAAAATKYLRRNLDEFQFHQRTGCRFHPSYWPAKLLQLQEEQPHEVSITTHWLSFSDYVLSRWCGQTGTSISMASGTGLMNHRNCDWDQDLLNFLKITQTSLPAIQPDAAFFLLNSEYSSRWTVLSKAKIFPAIGDGAANNIGTGCTTKHRAALMIGTSGAARVLYKGQPPTRVPPELWCYRANREYVVTGGALSDGGNLHASIRRGVLPGVDDETLEHQLSEFEPDSHGLTVLPFWSGERSTGWYEDARGVIEGRTDKTTPIEILRAAMEAVAYRFALIFRALEPIAPSAEIFCSGNALHASRVWVQILADVLGRELQLIRPTEASTRGAALLAFHTAGKIQSIEDISVPIAAVVKPDMSRHARYQQGLVRQQQMYERTMHN